MKAKRVPDNSVAVVRVSQSNQEPITTEDIDRILDRNLRTFDAGHLSAAEGKMCVSLVNSKLKHVMVQHVIANAVGLKSHPRALAFAQIRLENKSNS
jgi:hypothetical protein